jgi:hypothetical protein
VTAVRHPRTPADAQPIDQRQEYRQRACWYGNPFLSPSTAPDGSLLLTKGPVENAHLRKVLLEHG